MIIRMFRSCPLRTRVGRVLHKTLRNNAHGCTNEIAVYVPHVVVFVSDRAYVALHLAKSTGAVTVDRRNVLLRYRKKRVRTQTYISIIIVAKIVMLSSNTFQPTLASRFYSNCITNNNVSYFVPK